MGQVITINNTSHPVICPEDDLRYLISEYMGSDSVDLYDQVLDGILCDPDLNDGDDYERIADGWLQFVIEIRDELEGILSSKRLDRGKLSELYDKLLSNT